MSRTNHLLCCSFPTLLAMTTTSRWEGLLWDCSESERGAISGQVLMFAFSGYSLRGKGMLSLWEPRVVVQCS